MSIVHYRPENYRNIKNIAYNDIIVKFGKAMRAKELHEFCKINAFIKIKTGYILDFTLLSNSPLYEDVLRLLKDDIQETNKAAFQVKRFVLKIFQINNELEKNIFMRETRNNVKLNLEYQERFASQPLICPRIFYTSSSFDPTVDNSTMGDLTGPELIFLDLLKNEWKDLTIPRPVFNKSFAFYLTEHKGKNLETILDDELQKRYISEKKVKVAPQIYGGLIRNLNGLSKEKWVDQTLAWFDQKYLKYARRLLLRLAELSYIHLDIHLKNIVIDDSFYFHSKHLCFYIIDLEDLIKLKPDDHEFLSGNNLRESRLSTQPPSSNDSRMFRILAGEGYEIPLFQKQTAMPHTLKYFVDDSFKENWKKEAVKEFLYNDEVRARFNDVWQNHQDIIQRNNERKTKGSGPISAAMTPIVNAIIDGDHETTRKNNLLATLLEQRRVVFGMYAAMYGWVAHPLNTELIHYIYGAPVFKNLKCPPIVSEVEYSEFVQANLLIRLKGSVQHFNPSHPENYLSKLPTFRVEPEKVIRRSTTDVDVNGKPIEYEYYVESGRSRRIRSRTKNKRQLCVKKGKFLPVGGTRRVKSKRRARRSL